MNDGSCMGCGRRMPEGGLIEFEKRVMCKVCWEIWKDGNRVGYADGAKKMKDDLEAWEIKNGISVKELCRLWKLGVIRRVPRKHKGYGPLG